MLGLLTVIIFAVVGLATITPANAAPLFRAPFTCGQVWTAATYSSHSPQKSIDWNYYPAEQEIGKLIRASRGGTVVESHYSTTTGYGNVVRIDHGGGWSTFYAHLASRSVSKGQVVATGQRIGVVGKTSAKYNLSVHLHYEQRYNNSAVAAAIDGVAVTYYAKRNYTSRNC
jgi:hypothetical protein